MADVTLSGICKAFIDPAGARFEAVRDVDLEIRSGECFSLLGPSGCGKTTLLRIISGLEFPDSGTVVMDGRDVTRLAPEKRPTAMVFQSYALFPHLTVEGNIVFGLRVRGKTREEIRNKVEEVLELVQLRGLNARRMHELSGGQQQRVALARVLAIEPSILLMDEPLSNLDASLRRSTRSVIRKIQTELGLTLIYVTHDQEEGLMISDRLALMMEGLVLQVGTPRELFESPATARVARFLGQRNMIAAVVNDASENAYALCLSNEENSVCLDIKTGITPGNVSKGDPVWLALRPVEILLSPDDGKTRDGWPAEVLMTSFAGDEIEIEARLIETQEVIRIAQQASGDDKAEATSVPIRGDRVIVRAREGAGMIYERGAGKEE